MKYFKLLFTLCLISSITAQKQVLSFDEKISFFLESINSKNYESYIQYEDEIYASIENEKGNSDSLLISIVYPYFISPNLYDFNQFEKAIAYMDFIIPKVINYCGEYSVENSLYHHERAYALRSLGLIEEEITTREYNNKIFEKLLTRIPEQVLENYDYNLFFLDQLYTAKNDHLNELKILIRRLDVARDKNEEFDQN